MENNQSSVIKDTDDKKVEIPDYSDDEIKYIGSLQTRLETARDNREKNHPEYNNMSYSERWEQEEKDANTFIEPAKNEDDIRFVSGTIRQKLFALLAHIANLDLSCDISAYDENEMPVVRLGNAIENIIEKTNELDEDKEKKLLRQYELLKHGHVFLEEIWEERWGWVSKMLKKFDGTIKGSKWEKTWKKIHSKCVRNILSGLNVYLGDINQYFISKQPYIFTTQYISYAEAEGLYGKWERWKYVTKYQKQFSPSSDSGILFNNWALNNVDKDQVEVVKYQDKWNNEYAVILNGVLMTPIGLPLPQGYQDYNIIQQNLEPINTFFAYGGSMIARIKTKVGLLDEMLKLAILKTQKSFMPPYLNMSGKVISRRVLMPGKITSGLSIGDLSPIDANQTQGVSASEWNMISELKSEVDRDSTSPQFSGQQGEGQTTATEVVELQRQAKLALGLTILACSLLEEKLGWLRLYNILENWFEPQNEVVDEAKGMIVNKYRVTNRQIPIEGEGLGREIVLPTDQEVTPQQVYNEEESLKEQLGEPVKIIVLNPQEIKRAKYIWQISVTPKEGKSNEVSKLMFRAMMADIGVFGQDVNMSYLEDQFATVWDRDSSKLFNKQPAPTAPPVMPGQEKTKATGVNIPGMPNVQDTTNKAMGNVMKQGL